MFFLYFILAIVVLSIILTFFTSIEIEIKNLNYLGDKKENINKNYEMIIKLYLFEKIELVNIKITPEKLKKEKLLNKLEQKMINSKKKIDVKILNILKNVKLKIINLDIQIELSLEDAAQNAIFVGIIYSVIPIILKKFIERRKQN